MFLCNKVEIGFMGISNVCGLQNPQYIPYSGSQYAKLERVKHLHLVVFYKFITNQVESWSRVPKNISENFQKLV